MRGWKIGSILHSDESLVVCEATSGLLHGNLVVRQHSCGIEDADYFLKEAFAQTLQPCPWAPLRVALFCDCLQHVRFNFVYERLRPDLKDYRSSFVRPCNPGISKYRKTSLLYENPRTRVSIFTASDGDTQCVVKVYGPFRSLHNANDFVREALTQAQVRHPHSTEILDIGLFIEDSCLKIGLVLEQLKDDVHSEIATRKWNSYSEEELLLFLLQITAALEYAKTKGVAHRDIKPGNIFTTQDGLYKLGDFGSSWRSRKSLKFALDTSISAHYYHEQTEEVDGTCLYMSPEMRLSMMDTGVVDSYASDVYSLGVTVLEMAALEFCKGLSTANKEQLGSTIEHSLNELCYSDDFKGIMKKMLAVEYQERATAGEVYQSVAKLLRRSNPTLCIAANPYVHLAVAQEAILRQIERLETDSDALKLAELYQQMSEFKLREKKLEEAEKWAAKAYQTTSKLFDDNPCDTATSSEPSALRNAPLMQTYYDLRAAISHQMGKLSDAIDFYQKAIKTRQASLPGEHPDLVKCYSDLATAYHQMGKFTEACEMCQRCLCIRKATLPANHHDIAICLNNLGTVFLPLDKHSEALECFTEALNILRASVTDSHPLVTACFDNIALVYERMGRYSESLEYSQKALYLSQSLLPDTHPDFAMRYINLATTYYSMGDQHKACENLLQSLRIQYLSLPENHPDIASAYNNLAIVYHEMGELNEAAKCSLKCQGILSLLDSHSPCLEASYNTLASIYQKMGKLLEATEYSLKSLGLKKQLYPANHPNIAKGYNNLGSLYEKLGKLSEAAELNLKCLGIMQSARAEGHPLVATAQHNMSVIYQKLGRLPEALEFAQQSLKARLLAVPENGLELAMNYNILGIISKGMRKLQEALDYTQKALKIRQAQLPEIHPDIATSYNNLSAIYIEMGKLPEAEETSIKSLRIRQSALPESHPDTIANYNNLAIIYQRKGNLPKAAESFLESIRVARVCFSELHPSIAQSYCNLAIIFHDMGKLQEALELCQKSLSIRQTILPPNHPDIARSSSVLVSIATEIRRKALSNNS